MENTKKCHYCGEEILATAKKCKHCGQWLEIECPFCAETISAESKICPHCNSNVESQKQIEQSSSKDNNLEKYDNDEVSDSWKTILLKIGLAIVGALILSCLFPHAFSDKIVLTNKFTGEKIEIPVESKMVNGEKEYSIKVSILEGDEHTFYSKDKEALTKFITKVKEQEMRMIAEMRFRGQDVNHETTTFFSLDEIIYTTPKLQYNIYEHSDKTHNTTHKNNRNSAIEQRGDIIDTYADNHNHPNSQQEQSSRKIQQPIQSIPQVSTPTNIVVPQGKPIQVQQHNNEIDDFMN